MDEKPSEIIFQLKIVIAVKCARSKLSTQIYRLFVNKLFTELFDPPFFIEQFPDTSEALGWKLHEWTKEELEEMGWEDFRDFHRKPDESAHE